MTEQSPVVPSVGAVPVEMPEVEFDFTLTSTIAEAVLNGPGEWIGIGAELALLASVVREKVKPLIAARVQAELEAEDECPRTTCQQIAATASDVYCEVTGGQLSYPTYDARTILSHANDQTQKLIDDECARVRAEERQRITEGLDEFVVDDPEIGRDYGFNAGLQQARWVAASGFAAGSAIPVATPEATVEIGGQKMTQAQFDAARFPLLNPPPCSSCRRRKSGEEPPGSDLCWPCLRVERHHGYVARVEPVDEVKCPDCEATIRARMSDQPEVAPAEPTIAEQAGYYVVTFPGGDTSTWETNRSYLFNPTAVWQLRNNADALEAITRHRSRTAPAEQDGQR